MATITGGWQIVCLNKTRSECKKCSTPLFRSVAAAAFSPRLQPGVGGEKKQSISRETATVMVSLTSTISTNCFRRFTA
jgi:hypothetical protein